MTTEPLQLQRQTSPSTGLSYLSNATSPQASLQQISLFIPGFGCPATDYIPLITHLHAHGRTLSAGHVYVAVDLPGHGESPTAILPTPEAGGVSELLVQLHAELLSTLFPSSASSPNPTPIPTTLYGHSMGTLTVLDLFAHTLTTAPSSLKVAEIILLDGPYAGTTPPTPLDLNILATHAEYYRSTMPDRIARCFGPHTSPQTIAAVQDAYSRLDFAYLIRMSHYYGTVDGRFAQILHALNRHNDQLVATGEKPVRLLDLQSQEGDFESERKSLRKSDVTAHAAFVRKEVVGRWLREYVVEGTGHFPHVDDVEEVGGVVRGFLAEGLA
ncbi:alpha/beta fold hydrolase [Aspergillus fijiensis CBS 313.89]|uniref:Alpha/beta-hydrolase n=1 Tax=Aspergillus fijiensis CBS 313.89 TaxID=1448319 RepID=A0A8G1VTU8_9EURO|nr:alpha/beta-hydrolase [Aspergillus fijiensis CBS 313.89]RAK71461.1 alpha/beta-hydrolase [Aspergillus fijiensis CBS 313.89]